MLHVVITTTVFWWVIFFIIWYAGKRAKWDKDLQELREIDIKPPKTIPTRNLRKILSDAMEDDELMNTKIQSIEIKGTGFVNMLLLDGDDMHSVDAHYQIGKRTLFT